MAWHASTVVHNSRDVAGREDCSMKQNPASLPRGAEHWANPSLPPSPSRTYSPLASSSQISKKTIRSYLHWQGPALGRVMVLSFVAGTAVGQKRQSERFSLLLALRMRNRMAEEGQSRQGPQGMHRGSNKSLISGTLLMAGSAFSPAQHGVSARDWSQPSPGAHSVPAHPRSHSAAPGTAQEPPQGGCSP